jgi:pimeloyl-ACP methyl ester carboxylesterase
MITHWSFLSATYFSFIVILTMQHLILLHGAIGAKDQLQNLADILKDKFIVHYFNFSGHGGNRFPNADFSISHFANDVLEEMEQKNISRANFFGYSMGGYVAMWLAKSYPGKVEKIITLATKFYWDEQVAAKEIKMLNAEVIQEKIPAFAQQLQQRHAPNDWKLVLEKTSEMLNALGRNNELKLGDYQTIVTPCLLLLGENDKMITVEETVAVQKALPNAELKFLPATPHPIEQVDLKLLSSIVENFLTTSK